MRRGFNEKIALRASTSYYSYFPQVEPSNALSNVHAQKIKIKKKPKYLAENTVTQE